MTTQVVVIGGGYAGVMAANRLMERRDLSVALVNPRERFIDRIRLHQQAVGNHDAALDYGDLLNDRVRRIVGTATRIDRHARTVEIDDGRVVRYDHLVYAVGSAGAAPAVPGAEHAYGVSTWEEAEELRGALARAGSAAAVAVVGAGPTGIEMAGELAEQGHRVSLIAGDQLGPYLHEAGRRRIRAELETLGVAVVESVATAVEPDGVRLRDGVRVAAALTVWTAGFEVPDLARRSGLRVDARGRLLTDETLTSVDDERIVAAGDAVDPSGQPLRMSCQAAVPLGVQAAQTILTRLDGGAPRPIDSGFVGQCVSVGRRLGLYQVARADDTARGMAVGGRVGGLIKEKVATSIPAALAKEARRPGSFWWPSVRTRAHLRTSASPADVTSAA